jgi:hypothetical protein
VLELFDRNVRADGSRMSSRVKAAADLDCCRRSIVEGSYDGSFRYFPLTIICATRQQGTLNGTARLIKRAVEFVNGMPSSSLDDDYLSNDHGMPPRAACQRSTAKCLLASLLDVKRQTKDDGNPIEHARLSSKNNSN